MLIEVQPDGEGRGGEGGGGGGWEPGGLGGSSHQICIQTYATDLD